MSLTLLDQIDAEIAITQSRLTKLHAARAALASLDAPIPASPRPAARPTPVAPSARPVATSPTPGARDRTRDLVDAEVLAYLERQRTPTTRVAVIGAIKRPQTAVVQALDRLAARGQIVRRGVMRAMRLGTPAVMAVDPEGD